MTSEEVIAELKKIDKRVHRLWIGLLPDNNDNRRCAANEIADIGWRIKRAIMFLESDAKKKEYLFDLNDRIMMR